MVATAMGSKVIGPNRKTGLTPQATRTIGGVLRADAIYAPITSVRKIAGPDLQAAKDAAQGKKTNESLRAQLGIDTVLDENGKKKRRSLQGLRGGQETLSTLLGE